MQIRAEAFNRIGSRVTYKLLNLILPLTRGLDGQTAMGFTRKIVEFRGFFMTLPTVVIEA